MSPTQAERRAQRWERAVGEEEDPRLARAYALEVPHIRTSRHPGNKLSPPCKCCKHRDQCGLHHSANPNDWDKVVGPGCLCPT